MANNSSIFVNTANCKISRLNGDDQWPWSNFNTSLSRICLFCHATRSYKREVEQTELPLFSTYFTWLMTINFSLMQWPAFVVSQNQTSTAGWQRNPLIKIFYPRAMTCVLLIVPITVQNNLMISVDSWKWSWEDISCGIFPSRPPLNMRGIL